MVALGPLAAGILEGTLLALMGVLLFQLRHRAGLIPYIFLIGGLALTIPFTAHLTPLQLDDPWTISRAYAIVLPVFVTLVLLLHILVGSLEARIAASLPLLGAGLVAAATTVSTQFPVVIPEAFLPSVAEVLAAGTLVSVGAVAATALFEWWHRYVARAPAMLVFVASSLAGVLVHGLTHLGLQQVGLALPGGSWPAIVAVPLVAGAAPVVFVAVYAEVVLGDLASVAERTPPDPDASLDDRDLERYRRAQARLREATAWVQEAAAEHGADDHPADVGFLVADPEGRVLHATDPVAWMLGQGTGDIVGEEVSKLFGTPLTNGHAPDEDGTVSGTHRVTVRRAGGDERVLEVQVSRTPNGAQRAIVEDRTASVARLAAHRQRDRARCAIDILGRDIPNLLAAPRSQAERLAELAAEEPIPEAADRLADQIHDGLADVHEALERARTLRELDDPVLEALDLNALLRDAVRDLDDELLDAAEIRWRTPTCSTTVRTSPLVKSAVEEFLANACEHGGSNVRITIGLDRRGGSWLVTIDDDGPGVPDELKTRIFDGFRKRRDARTAGLGLHLARAVVEALGGRVWVEDRVPGCPEKGASFRIEIPAGDEHGVAEGSPALASVDDAAAEA